MMPITREMARQNRLARLGLLEEPMGYVDGMTLYEYVGSNPTSSVDPLGLAANLEAPFQLIGSEDMLVSGTLTVKVWFDRQENPGLGIGPNMRTTYTLSNNYVSSMSMSFGLGQVQLDLGSTNYRVPDVDTTGFTSGTSANLNLGTDFKLTDQHGKVPSKLFKIFVEVSFDGDIRTKAWNCSYIEGTIGLSMEGAGKVRAKGLFGKWSDDIAVEQQETKVSKAFSTRRKNQEQGTPVGTITAGGGGETPFTPGKYMFIEVLNGSATCGDRHEKRGRGGARFRATRYAEIYPMIRPRANTLFSSAEAWGYLPVFFSLAALADSRKR